LTSIVLSEDDKATKDSIASADSKDESVAEKQSNSTTLKALLAKKEYDAAVEFVDRAFVENPDGIETPLLEISLGTALLRAARSEQAAECFRMTIDRYLNAESLSFSQLQALVLAPNIEVAQVSRTRQHLIL